MSSVIASAWRVVAVMPLLAVVGWRTMEEGAKDCAVRNCRKSMAMEFFMLAYYRANSNTQRALW